MEILAFFMGWTEPFRICSIRLGMVSHLWQESGSAFAKNALWFPDRMMRPRQLVVSKFWNHNELEERRGNSQPHLVPKQPYATKPFFALIPSRCDATICNPNADTLENIFGEILDSFPMPPCCVGTENERYQTWISWATILAMLG